MRKNYATPHMLNYPCTNMSKVAERIRPHGCVYCLEKEISLCSVDDDVALLADDMNEEG